MQSCRRLLPCLSLAPGDRYLAATSVGLRRVADFATARVQQLPCTVLAHSGEPILNGTAADAVAYLLATKVSLIHLSMSYHTTGEHPKSQISPSPQIQVYPSSLSSEE